MRGAGDSFGDELEERARKRLELEEVRQKRVALELQLGARRKDAEAAQRRLAELSSGTLARAPSAEEQSEQSDGEEAALDAAQDPAQRHMLINERIALRRLQRAALAFRADPAVIAVLCDEHARPRVQGVTGLTTVTIAAIQDLGGLLVKGGQS
jgi:hypothetical protein